MINNIIVFNKGTPQALIVSIPNGGHKAPISGTGAKAE